MGKILIKRGLQANTSNLTLDVGEMALATDTGKVYIGVTSGKKEITSPVNSVNGQVGDITITSVEISNKLSNARTIALTGDVVATGNFDGSQNLTLTTTISTIDGGTF